MSARVRSACICSEYGIQTLGELSAEGSASNAKQYPLLRDSDNVQAEPSAISAQAKSFKADEGLSRVRQTICRTGFPITACL